MNAEQIVHFGLKRHNPVRGRLDECLRRDGDHFLKNSFSINR